MGTTSEPSIRPRTQLGVIAVHNNSQFSETTKCVLHSKEAMKMNEKLNLKCVGLRKNAWTFLTTHVTIERNILTQQTAEKKTPTRSSLEMTDLAVDRSRIPATSHASPRGKWNESKREEAMEADEDWRITAPVAALTFTSTAIQYWKEERLLHGRSNAREVLETLDVEISSDHVTSNKSYPHFTHFQFCYDIPLLCFCVK